MNRNKTVAHDTQNAFGQCNAGIEHTPAKGVKKSRAAAYLAEISTQGKPMRSMPEIVFVDDTITDIDSFLNNLRSDVEAVVLSSSTPGTAQMASVLAEREGVHLIHIVAHGNAGEIRFGGGILSVETLQEHSADLNLIGQALGDDGRLLLWSCHAGMDEAGASFLDALTRVSGAEVYAATGLVGSANLGGAWQLQTRSGGIEMRSPLTRHGCSNYA